MKTPCPIWLLCSTTLALSTLGAPASATPAACSFGSVVRVLPDANIDKGCEVHLLVQRGDLVDQSLELSPSPTLTLDFSQIQLRSAAGAHAFSVHTLPQLGANFPTRRTDCECTPEYGWYQFDHYLLIPDQRLPPSTYVEVQGLPNSATPPDAEHWGFATTAAAQGPGCALMGSLQAGPGPTCGSCDRCGSPDDVAPPADGGSDAWVNCADQEGLVGDCAGAPRGESTGCTLAAGTPRLPPAALLLLLALVIKVSARRTRRQSGS